MSELVPNADEVGKIVKRKIGGVPLAVWLGAGIATVAGVAWWRRRSRPAVSADAGTSDTGDTTAAAVPYGTSQLGTTFSAGTPAGSTSVATDPFTQPAFVAKTNADWRSSAESYMIGQGFNPTTVTAAIAKFLNGEGLTQQERAIVDTALRQIGPTPEPVAPPYNVPEPVPGNSDTGTAPGSEVGEPYTPPAAPTWRRVPWGVMGNLHEILAEVRRQNPQTASMTDDALLRLLESYGYAAWQRSNGGPIVVMPNGPPPDNFQT